MPNRITFEFYNPTTAEYWTNRWFHDAADIATTVGALPDMVAAHRNVLHTVNVLTKVRVDDNVPDTDNYTTLPYNLNGLVAAGSDPLPLFNVGRIDFGVDGGGRPSRKYLRGLLEEAGITMTSLGAATLTALNAFGSAMVAVPGLCDPQGQAITSYAVWPMPAMRQLRRGSKKKNDQSSPSTP